MNKFMIAAVVIGLLLLYWRRRRRRQLQAPGRLPVAQKAPLTGKTPAELIAAVQAASKPEQVTEIKEAQTGIQRLATIINALRGLQVRMPKEPSFAVQPEEIQSGEATVEHSTIQTQIAHDVDTKEYDVLLYLAYREYDRLRQTSVGQKTLDDYFSTLRD